MKIQQGHLVVVLLMAFAVPRAGMAIEKVSLEASVLTDASVQPFYFTLPAPRGQILDCQGQALARTGVVQRLTLRVPALPEETPQAYVAWVADYWPKVTAVVAGAMRPDAEWLKQQFEHRRRIPLAISEALSVETVAAIPRLPEFVEVQTEYAREYPGGTLAAHVVGYVTATGAPLRGPLLYGEPLWREVEGRDGLEASMNKELSGQPGLMVICYDKEGRAAKRQVLKPPVPGHDVVTTLQIPLQMAVEKALKSAGRPGAIVVVDSASGNLLAMASAPTFDPSLFARGLDKATFAKMTTDEAQPLFDRAISAQYPPGSVFKPFVALAGLREGRLNPYAAIPCGPELIIDGRTFRNWSDTDRGWFDLNAALIRSCNTYFYQAAITIGDQPILATARDFGFGEPIQLPLAGVATSPLPERVPTPQGQANLAIGQSPLLSSPVEVALAMATLSDGMRRPQARLVSQVQDQEGEVLLATVPGHYPRISYPAEALVAIHRGMYGVVNHRDGTATKARLKGLRVYGKTGTAQWSRDREIVNAVWFAGFVKDSDPPLAFAVALEGRKGERIFGGSVAAPIAAQWLASVAADPAKFAMRTNHEKAPLEEYPLISASNFNSPMVASPASLAGGGYPGYPVVMPRSAAASYYGDYPTTAPTALAQPAPLAETAAVTSPNTVADEVPRAIPLGELPAPDVFFNQPPPVPSPYYERARAFPRTSAHRFLFPSR